MNYETVVDELFERLPKLRPRWESTFPSMRNEAPDPYSAFGSVLIPALDEAASRGDLGMILPICAFLEDAAEAARQDRGLELLLQIEVGEWLGLTENEVRVAPWLGVETKRICGYVPGLATQRVELRTSREGRRLGSRISALMRKLRGK